MGCGASCPAYTRVPARSGWMGNRRPPPRTRAPASPAGPSAAAAGRSMSTVCDAPVASTSTSTTDMDMDMLVASPRTPAAARPSQELRIEAGMAATPVGPMAEEFKFFCPLCMCARELGRQAWLRWWCSCAREIGCGGGGRDRLHVPPASGSGWSRSSSSSYGSGLRAGVWAGLGRHRAQAGDRRATS